jgi:hypothetical protein
MGYLQRQPRSFRVLAYHSTMSGLLMVTCANNIVVGSGIPADSFRKIDQDLFP